MFDGIDAGTNSDLDTFGAVRMNRNASSVHVCLVDQCSHFRGRILLAARSITLGNNATSAAVLDDVDPILDVATNADAYAIDAVRYPGRLVLEFGRQQIVIAMSPGDPERRSGNQHARSRHVTIV